MVKRIIGWAAGGLTVAAVVLLGVIGTAPNQNGAPTESTDTPVSVVIEQNTLATGLDADASAKSESKAEDAHSNDSDAITKPESSGETDTLLGGVAPLGKGSNETSPNTEASASTETSVVTDAAATTDTSLNTTPAPELPSTPTAQTTEQLDPTTEAPKPAPAIETPVTADAEQSATPLDAAVVAQSSSEITTSTAPTKATTTNAQPKSSESKSSKSTPVEAQVETQARVAPQTSQTLKVDQPDPVERSDTPPSTALNAPEPQAPVEQTLAALANPTRETTPVGPEPQAETQPPEAGSQQTSESVAKLNRPTSGETPSSDPEAPSFDVVRVDGDGQTVIAGRATPDEQVEVLLDGKVVGEARADRSGQFVAVVFANLTDSAQRLELRATLPVEEAKPTETTLQEPPAPTSVLSDIAPSVESSLQGLAAPSANGDTTSLSAGGGGSAGVQRDDGSTGLAAPILSPKPSTVVSENAATPAAGPQYAVSNPVIILPSSSPDAAPTLVQPQREQLALLQPVQREIVGVVLDSITYDDTGAVILSGRGIAGRSIRIYANGSEQGVVRISADGSWRWASTLADPKSIKLFRLDEIDSVGEVTSRIETPFEYSRLSPQVVRDRRVVIQQGDALWRIAEQFYGDGIRYSTIYGANSELIRDPDLIYPGQVFTIPELVDAN